MYDITLGLLKIGEKDDMEKYFNASVNAYRSIGSDDMADDIALMVLPKDQELVDRVFNTSQYILRLHNKLNTN